MQRPCYWKAPVQTTNFCSSSLPNENIDYHDEKLAICWHSVLEIHTLILSPQPITTFSTAVCMCYECNIVRFFVLLAYMQQLVL